jgi:hypothetical protein
MSLIRLECASCHAILQVRAELAWQQGRCPKCGATVNVPAPAASDSAVASAAAPVAMAASPPPPLSPPASPPAPQPPAAMTPAALSLAQAMAPDMMAEIARRKKSAVLVVFETPTDGDYEISRSPAANVRCYRTADINDAQVMVVLGELGQMTQGQRNQKGGIGLRPDALPYELKGDRLGMTLADFKSKYARTVGGMKMPYCSDMAPGQANAALRSEPWHAAAGIVHGRVDLPSESNSPTVAGVKSELLLYHFVDGQLFRMTALFDTEAFHLVRDALEQKQGDPTTEIKDPLELAWANGVSTIRLVRGTMRPKKFSSLHFIHDELQRLAESRLPQRDSDL